MKYRYLTCCVSARGKDISDMMDRAREICYKTFARYVSIKEINEQFGYGAWLKVKDDWHVSYYRSKYRGISCIVFKHSGIEYIFVP